MISRRSSPRSRRDGTTSSRPAKRLIALFPDERRGSRIRYAISIPYLGSVIASTSLSSKEVGLTDFAAQDRPSVLIPFFAFRVMVGCGLVMLLLAWLGTYLCAKDRIERNRALLWCIFLSFPLPHIAILTGWFTAEVGRQPWTVYGVLRTADALTPFLTTRAATISLVVFCTVYVFIFSFGVLYIYRLLHAGPVSSLVLPPADAIPNRPMSVRRSVRLGRRTPASLPENSYDPRLGGGSCHCASRFTCFSTLPSTLASESSSPAPAPRRGASR